MKKKHGQKVNFGDIIQVQNLHISPHNALQH